MVNNNKIKCPECAGSIELKALDDVLLGSVVLADCYYCGFYQKMAYDAEIFSVESAIAYFKKTYRK